MITYAPSGRHVALRLSHAKLTGRGVPACRLEGLYRRGIELANEGVAFFRPSADLNREEVAAMRLGHADAISFRSKS